MASELTLTAALSFLKNSVADDFSFSALAVDVSGSHCVKETQTIATSETALKLGGITTPGYILIVNRDATNYVKIRGASGATDCVKIMPGKIALFQHSGTAPYLIANSSSCVVQYLLIEA